MAGNELMQNEIRQVRIAAFPSPRPSPSGKGRIVADLAANLAADYVGKLFEFLDVAACCSLSPRERVRVRGNGMLTLTAGTGHDTCFQL